MAYDFRSVESKWQRRWQEHSGLYSAKDGDQTRAKKYVLVEFPYPSGEGLHIGHTFTMTGADVYARFQRMKGYNTLFPMGWDAFGLPTENYAIKHGIQPAVATKNNTDHFREQMKRLAFSFDWDREINTTDPSYYKWTQWIFIQLFNNGLAYKQEMPINWCPSCKIGLANEEVVDGNCERCGAQTTKRTLSQWLLKITDYADRLIDELELTNFPNRVKASQTSWIGRTSGIIIDYPLVNDEEKVISCYSTRPDTNFGATFIVLAPERPECLEITSLERRSQVAQYIEEARKKSERQRIADYSERAGVFTGRYALNRLTGKEMPIYVADFVIASAGTGMVVGVPAHDERDFDFAEKHDLEIIPVIYPDSGEWDFDKQPYTEIDKGKMVNSAFLNGLAPRQAKELIIDYLEDKGWGRRSKNYHLRDWVFSRQHYWGEPIPMINCDKCGWVPVPEKQLPVELPEVERYEPTDTGESPLAAMTDWVNTTCPACGGPAKRETDTMPNWAGSSWYYLRYTDPHNEQVLADPAKLEYWQPVDVYVGGDEHTTLHLLYSRFWHKFLNDIGAVPGKEPYDRRMVHGVILGPDGSRMSKSRGNIVVPDEIIAHYGADAVRLYLMFIGPFGGVMAWNERALQGIVRFLERVSRLVPSKFSEELLSDHIHRLVKKVGEDIEDFKFNTAVAAMMEYLNKTAGKGLQMSREECRIFIRLLAPFAPYLAEELWEKVGGEFSVHQQSWPEYDENVLLRGQVELPVQINGRIRGRVLVDTSWSEEQILAKIKEDPQISPYLEGKTVSKEILVRGKIASFVAS